MNNIFQLNCYQIIFYCQMIPNENGRKSVLIVNRISSVISCKQPTFRQQIQLLIFKLKNGLYECSPEESTNTKHHDCLLFVGYLFRLENRYSNHYYEKPILQKAATYNY
ncbi:MAG: hypothetical protein HQK52_07535 [Oligoflexia bacterium]|nr:hypothetical protein [Oligoflexia bacterium]